MLNFYEFEAIKGPLLLAAIQERSGAHLVQGLIPLAEMFCKTYDQLEANPERCYECVGVTSPVGYKEFRLAYDRLSPIYQQMCASAIGVAVSLWEQMKEIIELVRALPGGSEFKEYELFKVGPLLPKTNVYWAHGVAVTSNYIRHRHEWPEPQTKSHFPRSTHPVVEWEAYMTTLKNCQRRNIETLNSMGLDRLTFLYYRLDMTAELIWMLGLQDMRATASKIDEWKALVIKKVSPHEKVRANVID